MDRWKPQRLALVYFLSVFPAVSLGVNRRRGEAPGLMETKSSHQEEISTLLKLEEKQVEWQTPAPVDMGTLGLWKLLGWQGEIDEQTEALITKDIFKGEPSSAGSARDSPQSTDSPAGT